MVSEMPWIQDSEVDNEMNLKQVDSIELFWIQLTFWLHFQKWNGFRHYEIVSILKETDRMGSGNL